MLKRRVVLLRDCVLEVGGCVERVCWRVCIKRGCVAERVCWRVCIKRGCIERGCVGGCIIPEEAW